MFGSSIPLSSILEPVGDLRGGQTGGIGQLPLLPRTGIGIVRVPVPQHAPRLLLEAVARLLAVPYRPGQREFSPHTVLPDGAQRPTWKAQTLHRKIPTPRRYYLSTSPLRCSALSARGPGVWRGCAD
jgi:hypothetical protein